MRERATGNGSDAADVLRALSDVTAPEGMEQRIVLRMRQRQAELSVRRGSRAARVGWLVAAGAAVACAAVVLLMPGKRMADPPIRSAVVNAPPVVRGVEGPVGSEAHARRPVLISSRAQKEPAVDQTSRITPPLPLTQQEKLLLAYARAPQFRSALVAVSTTEAVDNHGLGANTIFELDHQQLTPMPTTSPNEPTMEPTDSGDTQ